MGGLLWNAFEIIANDLPQAAHQIVKSIRKGHSGPERDGDLP
ncbi:MAG: hypothetical protein U0903_06370 [Planctomycetales bacterium]